MPRGLLSMASLSLLIIIAALLLSSAASATAVNVNVNVNVNANSAASSSLSCGAGGSDQPRCVGPAASSLDDDVDVDNVEGVGRDEGGRSRIVSVDVIRRINRIVIQNESLGLLYTPRRACVSIILVSGENYGKKVG